MEQYIPKAPIVAEIERRIKGLKDCHADTVAGYAGEISGLERLLFFLDTLEVKEVDLEKEISRVSKNEYFDFTDWKSVARHFFELGLQTHIPVIYKPTETDVYKLGLRAHKGE